VKDKEEKIHHLEPPEVTVLARETGVCTPVVTHLVPWLHSAHLSGVADTRIGHDELLHGSADLSIIDATIMVAIESVEEPLSLIRRHVIVEDSEKTHDLVEGDGTITSDLVPGTLKLGLTLWSPDGLVVHVGSKLSREDRIATRESTHRSSRRHAIAGHSGHGRLTITGHSGHGGLTVAGHTVTGHSGHRGLAVTRHSRHRRLIHLYLVKS